MMLDPSPQPPHTYLQEVKGRGCTTARPGELVTSALSFLVGPGAEKCPKDDHFALFFGYFTYFLPKHRKTLRIARQLVSSISIWLARKKCWQMIVPGQNQGMKVAPFYLSFIGNKRKVKIKTLISFERSHHMTGHQQKPKQFFAKGGIKSEVKIRTLILFERSCCSNGQLADQGSETEKT